MRVLIGMAALATLAVAARHVYVQSLPPGSLPSCGAPLSVLLKFTPLFEVIRKVLTGSGECGEVNWRFLGLAMPAWVALWALALAAPRPDRQPQAKSRRSTLKYMRCRASMSATRTALVHLVDRGIRPLPVPPPVRRGAR